MAWKALELFPIQAIRIKCLGHHENATFRVVAKEGVFLLRLHRENYHTKEAVLEELAWLEHLRRNTEINVQRPILSNSAKLIECIKQDYTPTRYCSLLSWTDGSLKFKGFKKEHFFSLGKLTAELQNSTSKISIKHRKYWDSDGLLGTKAKFGSFSNLSDFLNKRNFRILDECRLNTYRFAKSYQAKFPKKLSLIHADLHFGNILWHGLSISPIDFDDCGYGFHMYDLAVTLYSSGFKRLDKEEVNSFTENLLLGYSLEKNLSQQDLDLIRHLIVGRELSIVSWLFERRSNPKLYKVLKERIDSKVDYFNNSLKNGPASLFF